LKNSKKERKKRQQLRCIAMGTTILKIKAGRLRMEADFWVVKGSLRRNSSIRPRSSPNRALDSWSLATHMKG
jgi:hypothetical protein